MLFLLIVWCSSDGSIICVISRRPPTSPCRRSSRWGPKWTTPSLRVISCLRLARSSLFSARLSAFCRIPLMILRIFLRVLWTRCACVRILPKTIHGSPRFVPRVVCPRSIVSPLWLRGPFPRIIPPLLWRCFFPLLTFQWDLSKSRIFRRRICSTLHLRPCVIPRAGWPFLEPFLSIFQFILWLSGRSMRSRRQVPSLFFQTASIIPYDVFQFAVFVAERQDHGFEFFFEGCHLSIECV
jgi:hypothetical protein